MKRLLRILLPTAIAAVSLFAMALPASANTVSMTTGGCTGSATSYQSWFNTFASASTAQGCTWKYLDCYWQQTNLSIYHGCPGWIDRDIGLQPGGTQGVSSCHSLCAAGGPCSSSVIYHISAGVFTG